MYVKYLNASLQGLIPFRSKPLTDDEIQQAEQCGAFSHDDFFFWVSRGVK